MQGYCPWHRDYRLCLWLVSLRGVDGVSPLLHGLGSLYLVRESILRGMSLRASQTSHLRSWLVHGSFFYNKKM